MSAIAIGIPQSGRSAHQNFRTFRSRSRRMTANAHLQTLQTLPTLQKLGASPNAPAPQTRRKVHKSNVAPPGHFLKGIACSQLSKSVLLLS